MAFNIFATATSDIPLANLDANFTLIGAAAAVSTLYPTATTSITYGTAGTNHYFSGAGLSVTNALTVGTTLGVTGAGTIQGLTVGLGAGAVSTNAAFGTSALVANTTGSHNTAFGYNAMLAETNSVDVTAVGYLAGAAINGANGGTFIGASAGTLATGAYNTAIGVRAGAAISTGIGNTFIGASSVTGNGAGYSVTTGSNNVIIGGYAGSAADSETVVLSNGSGTVMLSAINTGAVTIPGSTLIGTSFGSDVATPTGTGLKVLAGSYYLAGLSTGYFQISGGYGNSGSIGAWNIKSAASGTGASVTQDLVFSTIAAFSGTEVTRVTFAASGAVTIPGTLALGTNPSTAGTLRLPKGTGGIQFRNNANSADIPFVGLDTNNDIEMLLGSGGKIRVFTQGYGAEPLQIASTGLTVTGTGKVSTGFAVGNATPLTNGITFPAAQAGVIAGANTLDDYEEGTWTPTLTPSTSGTITLGSPNACGYTKIGRLVTVNGLIDTASVSSPIGASVTFNNLPFASNATGTQRSAGTAIGFALSSGTVIGASSIVSSTTSFVVFINASLFQPGSQVYFQLTYTV